MALNPQQFGAFVNTGPAHARLAHETAGGVYIERVVDNLRKETAVRAPQHVHRDQGQFFDPNKISQPEPHQQTPAAFAADPRSWWHGRFQKSPRLTKGGSDEGFHAGSEGAARQRLQNNFGRRSGDTPARMFPLRLVGKMGAQTSGEGATRGSSPEEPGFDRTRHAGLSDRGRGYFYKNTAEGPEGEISVGVPKREGFLATHREFVEHALSEGQFVHPNIAWAAKKAPQHTGEDAMAHKRSRPNGNGRQMGLVEGIEGTLAEGKVRRAMYAPPETRRRSYVTESGETQHVYKPSGNPTWRPVP